MGFVRDFAVPWLILPGAKTVRYDEIASGRIYQCDTAVLHMLINTISYIVLTRFSSS